MKANRTCLITSNWEMGAGKKGTAEGPARIKSLIETLEIGKHIVECSNVNSKSSEIKITPITSTEDTEFNPLKNVEGLIQHASELSETIENCIVSGKNPLVLSGDHSNAIGTVSGLCRAFGGEHIGIIWIDAHLDLHSPFTTPSGNIHGMSVNALMEDDNSEEAIRTLGDFHRESWHKLKQIKSNKPNNGILPKHVVFIGIRSYEEQEWRLTEKHNILVITVEEIQQHGTEWLLNTVNEHLKQCLYRYVSFDVDSLDSTISSATGTPEDHGLDIATACELFNGFWQHPQTVCMEITEFNPHLPNPQKLDEALMACFNSVMS